MMESTSAWSLRLSFYSVAFFILSVCVILRSSTLELLDLIDPTESRYALVAAEMFTGGDWLTPHLVTEDGVTPYLGKPPLHFWLTAMSYNLFGLDEWVARLPSFGGLLLILSACVVYSRRFLNKNIAPLSALVCISSFLMFFLSGASVVDTTFTAFLTFAMLAFALSNMAPNETIWRRWACIFFVSLALATMIKGPVALVLAGGSLFFWGILSRRFRSLFRLPWVSGLLLFSALTAPWFYFAEQANPGFLKYFFVNENFLRFFVHNYGDKYGTGHEYPYGAASIMSLLAFLPWTPVLGLFAWLRRKEFDKSYFDTYPQYTYLICWAAFPVLFFSAAKQLHPAYILPAIPPLAMLTASLINQPIPTSGRPSRTQLMRIANFGFPVLAVSALVGSMFFNSSLLSLLIAFCVLSAAAFPLILLQRSKVPPSVLASVAAFTCVALYSSVILLFSEYTGTRRSSENILRLVSEHVATDGERVTVVGNRAYSAHWVSKAWSAELRRPLTISFVNAKELEGVTTTHMIIEKDDFARLTPDIQSRFNTQLKTSKWIWLSRKES